MTFLISFDATGFDLLEQTIRAYYRKEGARHVTVEHRIEQDAWGEAILSCYFVVEHQHEMCYVLSHDRGSLLGGVMVRQGDKYVPPIHVYPQAAGQSTSMEAAVWAVDRNLALMDECLGYDTEFSHLVKPPKRAYY